MKDGSHKTSAALAPLDSSRLCTKLNVKVPPKTRFSKRISLDASIDVLLRAPAGGKGARESFDADDRRFKELQATFNAAMSKPSLDLDPSRAKQTGLQPLAPRLIKTSPLPAGMVGGPTSPGGMGSGGMSRKFTGKFSVLPSISTAVAGNRSGPSSPAAPSAANSPSKGETYCPRTLDEVESVLPSEYFELKQMMELHMELKSQMSSNRAKLQELKDVEDDESGVLGLLREQASHVVSMMKDVLVRLEGYPEELWAMYGTVEAYEGGLAEDTNSTALLELYSQLLVHVQAFLNATATVPTE